MLFVLFGDTNTITVDALFFLLFRLHIIFVHVFCCSIILRRLRDESKGKKMKDTERETNTQVKIARKKERDVHEYLVCLFWLCMCIRACIVSDVYSCHSNVRAISRSPIHGVFVRVSVCIPMPIHSSV